MQENLQLKYPVEVDSEERRIIIRRNSVDFGIDLGDIDSKDVESWLGILSSDTPPSSCDAIDNENCRNLIAQLNQNDILDERNPPVSTRGIDALFEIEDHYNLLLDQTLNKNTFWLKMLDNPESVPKNVLYGMAIENYHFLFRESYFDSPVLGYLSSTPSRLVMNEFYKEEIGHDELIVRSLYFLGITKEDLAHTLPLPGTLALCNALSHWAATDPIFFFTTLGILEGKGVKPGRYDSYLEACQKANLPEGFIKPLRSHAEINRDGDHGNLTRAMFEGIQCIDREEIDRIKRQSRVFMEMYDNLYTEIWTYYSSEQPLLRKMPV